MNTNQKESIIFYETNDYLLINNLLWENLSDVVNAINIINTDSQGVISEALSVGVQKRWGHSEEICNWIFECYKKRVHSELTCVQLDKCILRAIQDIENIMEVMQPLEQDTILYRNVRGQDVLQKKQTW